MLWRGLREAAGIWQCRAASGAQPLWLLLLSWGWLTQGAQCSMQYTAQLLV